ncbi:MAG: histidine kinase [Chitinophagales bacterium]
MAMWGTPIPELLRELNESEGSARIDVLHYLALAHKFVDKNTAFQYADQALELCAQLQLPKEEMDNYTVRAILESGATADDSERAIVHLYKAVDIAISIQNEEGRLAALQKIGWHKLRQHKMAEAGAILMQCIEDYKLLPDTMAKDEGYRNAAIYLFNVDLKAAAELSLKGLELVRQHGRAVDAVHHLSMLQKIALKSGDDDKAIEYAEEILRIKDSNNDQTSLTGTAKLLGKLYLKKGDTDKAQHYFLREVALHQAPVNAERKTILQRRDAESYFLAGLKNEAFVFSKEAIRAAEEENNLRELGNATFQMGHICFLNENYDEAISCLEQSIKIRGEDVAAADRITTLDLLQQAYANTGSHQKAYETLVLKVKDDAQLVNSERVKEVTLLNQRYETEKRESELRELKIRQQQLELARTSSELKAIKAQMNPHFIFNALNSIQEMFFIGDKRMANEHLGQFSSLTRDILKASRRQHISVPEEVEMLNKYIRLEGMRFENDFSFSIELEDEEALEDVTIPPMLIQPYVENAIRHGLLHKKGPKQLKVRFSLNEENTLLECCITDNGIGREAAALINRNRSALHESFSTQANSKRLELLNQGREQKIGAQYTDSADGTSVSIFIPVRYD